MVFNTPPPTPQKTCKKVLVMPKKLCEFPSCLVEVFTPRTPLETDQFDYQEITGYILQLNPREMLLFDFGNECKYNCKKLLAFLLTATILLTAQKWK